MRAWCSCHTRCFSPPPISWPRANQPQNENQNEFPNWEMQGWCISNLPSYWNSDALYNSAPRVACVGSPSINTKTLCCSLFIHACADFSGPRWRHSLVFFLKKELWQTRCIPTRQISRVCLPTAFFNITNSTQCILLGHGHGSTKRQFSGYLATLFASIVAWMPWDP